MDKCPTHICILCILVMVPPGINTEKSYPNRTLVSIHKGKWKLDTSAKEIEGIIRVFQSEVLHCIASFVILVWDKMFLLIFFSFFFFFFFLLQARICMILFPPANK